MLLIIITFICNWSII